MRTVEVARARTEVAWAAGAAALAAAVGLVGAVDLKVALAVTVALVLTAAILVQPSWLLPALVASVFVEVVTVGGVPISRLLAPVVLLVVLAASTRPESRIRGEAPLVWAALYGIWALASGLWTVSIGGTTFLLASLAVAFTYMVAFAALVTSRQELERVLYSFSVAAFAIGVFAIAAFFLHFSKGVIEGRSTGGAGDPNFFAAYQLVALPLVLVLASEVDKRWVRVALALTVLVVIGSVLTSISRGGLLTLAVLAITMVALPARTVFGSPRQKAALLTVCVIGGAVAFGFSAGSVVPRLKETFAGESTSAAAQGSGRLEFWSAAWMSTKERPLLGLGYGAFANVSDDLIVRTPGINFQHFELRPKGSQVHNAYLSSLAELGIPGLVLFLGLLTSTAVLLRQTARRARAVGADFLARVANALLLSLLGWCIASLFLSTETSRAVWIVIGLSLTLPRLVRAEERSGSAV
jgi:O-antigen ligase